MEFIKDIVLVIGRILTILPLLLFITLFMGKRAIGELPVFDFLIVVTIGAVVGADIADPDIQHIPTAIAIIAIGLLQKVVAKWKISNRKVGKLLTFEPTIVVQNGKLLNKNLQKVHYSIDNILQMLREKDVFDVSEVETAIIEANGSLSVLKKPKKSTVTIEDLRLTKNASSLSLPVIMEGKIYTNTLKEFNLTEDWLDQQLSNQGITQLDHVFFASLNRNHELYISLRNGDQPATPPIEH
ncbi:DUF421 domain-containing protein [Virgibacillus xinjiangensis]|uniref:DUF421 domain-containing protein n=1 Tax=Virgibacillus xinjiangensis TaxID=393090 RepID=A0ABV7CXR2_9BACI